MAKLYWRIKRNGKWTWTAATPENTRYTNKLPWLVEYTGPEEIHYPEYGSSHVDKPEVYTDEES